MLRILLTASALNLLLILPLWWRSGTLGSPLIAWEAWVIAPAILLLPPGFWRRVVGVGVVSIMALATAANLGEAATYTAFGRPLNLYLDVPLVRSIYHLLVGNVGQLAAVCLMLIGGVLLLMLL